MKQRNIALCIIFSIITAGIYGIYWFVKMTNEVNELANPPKKTSGGIAFLLMIITCNIYGLYWAYNMGKLLDDAQTQRGKQPQNRAVLFLILQLLFPIATWAMVQSTINSMIPE